MHRKNHLSIKKLKRAKGGTPKNRTSPPSWKGGTSAWEEGQRADEKGETSRTNLVRFGERPNEVL